MQNDAPEKIWLLDYGHDECTWCVDPSSSGEDHSPVAYVRADTIATLQDKLDKAVEGLERIATLDSDGLPSFTPQAMVTQAQSLINELRP